jgi:predicted  nucleic acid-binding Zn-ribbon protein
MTTDDRIAKLEAQIDKLEAKQDELRKQLTQAQLDQWYARIEDLEVQVHLGAMETSDRLSALVQQLHKRWADAKAQVDGATSAAAEVVDSARSGIERAIQDVREALLESRKAAKH